LSGFPDDIELIMWTVILSDLVLVECSLIKDFWFCSLVSLMFQNPGGNTTTGPLAIVPKHYFLP